MSSQAGSAPDDELAALRSALAALQMEVADQRRDSVAGRGSILSQLTELRSRLPDEQSAAGRPAAAPRDSDLADLQALRKHVSELFQTTSGLAARSAALEARCVGWKCGECSCDELRARCAAAERTAEQLAERLAAVEGGLAAGRPMPLAAAERIRALEAERDELRAQNSELRRRANGRRDGGVEFLRSLEAEVAAMRADGALLALRSAGLAESLRGA
eukprot:TRINITY_DN36601_c0_g1_i1.p1 TRINITY_DN36601_c0_g1~~TRINITY_DN36601_c0_g1_i1.p1  ORF type:complete len:231 (+),score=99.15 TRINITY_DN36601_c0_g1_i1:42-695(+)